MYCAAGLLRLRNFVHDLVREGRLDGNIHGGHIDARPVGAQHNVRRLRIEPEVELAARLPANSGSLVCGFRPPPIRTIPRVSSAKCGSIASARAMLVIGPMAQMVTWCGCACTCAIKKWAASSSSGLVCGAALGHRRHEVRIVAARRVRHVVGLLIQSAGPRAPGA